MSDLTGVFICKCSNNISEKVNTGKLVEYFSGKENCEVMEHDLLCSEQGKTFIKEQIAEKGIKRLAIGACSPRQHEQTFRKVCKEAGVNPYLMAMANIREMCAWVCDDEGNATEKARAMINGALERVRVQDEIEQVEIDINPDALVIGAGVAGISAALLLAQKGRKVTLVEKAPCIGGMAVRYEDVFPDLDCAPCMLEPMMDEVLHHDNIEVLTYSEIEDVKGFLGNFIVSIKKKARYVAADGCFGCAECFNVCPVSTPNEYNQNLDERKAIFWPFPGAIPNVPVIDKNTCVRFTKGEECTECAEICGFGAVDYAQEDEVIEKEVGAVVMATGFGLYDLSGLENFGYGKIPSVITTLELERIVSSTGPTEGKVLLKDGSEPGSVAFIHCAGSRSKETNNYCSGICCMESLKLSHILNSKCESIKTTHIFMDLCIPGKEGQSFFRKIEGEGSVFIRVADTGSIKASGADGAVSLQYTDVKGDKATAKFDMVVLAPAMIPGSETAALAGQLQVTLDSRGFVRESHNRINAVSTNLDGVYSAGCVTGPMDISGSTNAGKAAAGEILSVLVPGEKLVLTAATAFVEESMCSGCRICTSLCPFKAIGFDEEKGVAFINNVLCQGCGTCVAACPGSAILNRHFSREQIFAEIEGVMA